MSRFIEDNLIDSIGPNEKGTILRSLAVFVAMEACGSFITGNTGIGSTATNFTAFCTSQYMPLDYHKVSPLLLAIFRNGVAHSYVAKGAALLSSADNAADCHLGFYEQGLCIYVPKLADDVKAAILGLVSDIKSRPESKMKYDSVLAQLGETGRKIYRDFVEANKIEFRPGFFTGDINTNLE